MKYPGDMQYMKALLACALLGVVPALAFAQAAAPSKPAPKPAVKAAAKPAAKPAARPAPGRNPRLSPSAQKAVEEVTPLEEPDPTIKLSEADIEMARKVYVGEIPCELGATVKITPLRREGFFLVTTGRNRFRMHPVESRTGAIRLEDPVRGAMWLQLGNKSMLMSQKLGQRLADECQSPDQVTFAEAMKGRPPVNILEPHRPMHAMPPEGAASGAQPMRHMPMHMQAMPAAAGASAAEAPAVSPPASAPAAPGATQ
jgi:hypothetical protein